MARRAAAGRSACPDVRTRDNPTPPLDWKPIFEAARLEFAGVHAGRARVDAAAIMPTARGVGSDRRPGSPDLKLRLEAGCYRGKPVYSSAR